MIIFINKRSTEDEQEAQKSFTGIQIESCPGCDQGRQDA